MGEGKGVFQEARKETEGRGILRRQERRDEEDGGWQEVWREGGKARVTKGLSRSAEREGFAQRSREPLEAALRPKDSALEKLLFNFDSSSLGKHRASCASYSDFTFRKDLTLRQQLLRRTKSTCSHGMCDTFHDDRNK